MGRLILITNDDGIDAGGIRQLAETAKAFGEVWVVAPESQRSGKSHSVTYLEPLYVRERPGYMDGVKAYECSGVPVDCVRVGIHLLGRKPDVVLSGINSGYNISGDIICPQQFLYHSCIFNGLILSDFLFDYIQ